MKRILSVLFLVLVSASLTTPAFGSLSFNASVTCKGPQFGIIGGSFAYWNWTDHGVPIGPFVQSGIIASSGVLHCNSTGGGPNTSSTTGTQPSNANGILVRLTSQIKGCYHTFFASDSFAPGQPASVNLKASCSANAYGTPVSETVAFQLKS